jgi:flagellin-like protein
MKQLLRNKKGVTPVVAAVIMILVTTIGMSVLFGFFVNYARDFQLGSGSAVLESFVVEDVWIQDVDTVKIWVYNVGKVDFSITDVYINDFRGFIVENTVDVEVGNHTDFIVIPSTQSLLTLGDPNIIRIVTARGTAVEGRFS